jgi:hypothetical protein
MLSRYWALSALGVLGFLLVVQEAWAQPPSCTVRLELVPRGALKEGLQGKLILRRDQDEGEPLILEAKVGASATAILPCESTWEVTADFPQTWAPRATVPAKANQVSRIALWPLGRIAGTVKLADKTAKLPKTISVTTIAPRSPKAPPDLPKGKLDCPLKEGRWECSLPAAAFDLVLSLEGFIPQYRWDFQVPAGKPADLGVMEWRRGASVAGWVAVEDGKLDVESSRARLTPLLGPGGGEPRIAEKIQSTTAEARVGKNGFFQFVGVSPGNYSLEVTQPGFAPGQVHPIEVWPQKESFLREPVVLKRPIQLEIAISPAADWLGDPWQVLVFRASDTSANSEKTVYRGPVDAQGIVTIKGQPPGRFSVQVSDKLGNRIASREVQILGPADAYQAIEIDVLTVHGTVKIGKEPLAATLWFGGRYGAQRVKMESDPEGNFHGILPKDGWWRIDIESAEPRLNSRTKVKVTADRQKRAEVDIVLPATHLFGRVLDDQGKPVRSAWVGLSTDEDSLRAETDDAGNFEFQGIPEGLAQAAATLSSVQGKWTSDTAVVFVREGADVGPIELRLRKTKRLSGRIQSSRGPVLGAGVVVLPLPPAPMFGDSTRTELDGSFAAQVPDAASNVAVIVSPPGYALKAFPVAASESSQDLTVTRDGGSLQVSLPPKSEDVEKEGVSLWVFQDGLPLPPDELYRWAAGHGQDHVIEGGQGILIPELAAGHYRVCLAARAALAQWQASGWTAPLAKCAAGQLTAGGTLRLDLSGVDRNLPAGAGN